MMIGKNVTIGENVTVPETVIIHDNVILRDNVCLHDYVVIYPEVEIREGTEVFDHSVLGKVPKGAGGNSREINCNLGPTIIGENCVISPSCVVYRGTTISNNTLLGDFCSIREDCKIGSYCIISRNVSVNYNTVIGNHVKIMDNSHITGDMKIGNYVFISVLVSTTNDNSMDRTPDAVNELGGPIIEDGVSVGAGANILPHVVIGANSIVGAGALVSRDVPANKVVMGIPAKVVRDVDR